MCDHVHFFRTRFGKYLIDPLGKVMRVGFDGSVAVLLTEKHLTSCLLKKLRYPAPIAKTLTVAKSHSMHKQYRIF